MNLFVENKQIAVGNVRIVGIASSSLFLIGDTESMILSSIYDTPLESVKAGPLIPLSPEA